MRIDRLSGCAVVNQADEKELAKPVGAFDQGFIFPDGTGSQHQENQADQWHDHTGIVVFGFNVSHGGDAGSIKEKDDHDQNNVDQHIECTKPDLEHPLFIEKEGHGRKYEGCTCHQEQGEGEKRGKCDFRFGIHARHTVNKKFVVALNFMVISRQREEKEQERSHSGDYKKEGLNTL